MVQKAQQVATGLATDLVAGRLAPGDPVPSVRVLSAQAGCSAGTAARAHRLLCDAGVITGSPRSRFVVAEHGLARAIVMAASPGVVRLSGSDDPALDLLTSTAGPVLERLPAGSGSVTGLSLLARGAADAVAVHLRDARTGQSNDAFTRRVLGGEPATVVHLWRRQQGIVVPSGNPRGIRGVRDLAGVRLAWRHPGTGSRLLLNRLLHDVAVAAHPEGETCDSHLGVAVAVATGAVEAGLAVRAAAAAVDAEFIPVEWEDFELAVDPEAMGALAPVLDVLATTTMQDRIGAIPGYDLGRSGDCRVAA